MKRYGHLWPEIVSFENLWEAFRKAARGKRRRPDVAQFFLKAEPSMDHEILKRLLRRRIKCPDTLWLVDLIIDSSNLQELVRDYFPGDDLFTPLERRKGLPIGNQTSQFFANVYLDPLDHFVRENLGKPYLRYVDDFLIFGKTKRELWETAEKVALFLEKYRLKLKPGGVVLYRTEDGFPLLGYRVFPWVVLVGRASVLRFRRRAREKRRAWREGKINLKEIESFVFGFLGHLKQARTERFREKLLNEIYFQRGRSP